MYEYESIEAGPIGRVQASEIWMELPLEPFASVEEMTADRDEWAKKLADATDRGAREAEMAVAVRFATWSERRLAAALNGPKPLTVHFPVQTIRIGNVAIVAVPFETMSETGTRNTSRCALNPDTFVLGYCNGMVSYLPTPQVSIEGGMEARLGYKAYLVPSAIPGDWEPTIRKQCLDMLDAHLPASEPIP